MQIKAIAQTPPGKVLVIDDDDTVRSVFVHMLKGNGYHALEAASGSAGLRVFSKEQPYAVLLDLVMPGMDGFETMTEIKKTDPSVPVIIVTGHGDVDTAVKAVKLGAYDFIVKPPKFDRLALTIKRAVEKFELRKTVRILDNAVETSLEWLLGKSPRIKSVIEQIRRVAASDFSVILQGETGTGKTYIARLIHNLSARAGGPFLAVDAGAIPETLLESEFFGYERGAFTGAEKKKRGFFEAANGGTILIDELQNISSYAQSKLLSAIDEKKFYPLGSSTPSPLDVRIIAASNSDVRESVKEKRLREDLFFRLGEFIIALPPIRERAVDIPFLAQRFLMDAASELNKRVAEITDEAMGVLLNNPWAGNIRELKNVIRRAVLLTDEGSVGPHHIVFHTTDEKEKMLPCVPLKQISATASRLAETKAISQALNLTGGNKSRAASILQVDYKTLLTKMREYGIR